MVNIKQLEGSDLPSKCTTKQSVCPQFGSQGIETPVYNIGVEPLVQNTGSDEPLHICKEEQSPLEYLLLAKWEEKLIKGQFMHDITLTEIKIITGRSRFLAQLNCGWRKKNISESAWLNHQQDNLLFWIKRGDKLHSDIIPSAAVPDEAVMIAFNVNPVEYGHVYLIPRGYRDLCHALDARFLDMIARIAIDMNNCSFRLFHDCSGSRASYPHFQACYFPDLLPVEFAPVELLYRDGDTGPISISTVIDYPIKTLLLEACCYSRILVEVVAEICSFLQVNNVTYNLLIADCGRKVFLFLQRKPFQNSTNLSAWECGGYFLFRSRQEFDQITETALLLRLSSFSVDDECFEAVRKLVCSLACKLH
ncbi:unnamed protein product [Linum trigynum]|uniref:GDP-L-galactose phosphorylase 1 n=1 Tax=Linum trigynum TaxID=586398 RepID=A0AAV2FX20_9ROSI